MAGGSVLKKSPGAVFCPGGTVALLPAHKDAVCSASSSPFILTCFYQVFGGSGDKNDHIY